MESSANGDKKKVQDQDKINFLQQQLQQQTQLHQLQQQVQILQSQQQQQQQQQQSTSSSLESLTNPRKLYSIDERSEEGGSPVTLGGVGELLEVVPDVAYDADVDDVVEPIAPTHGDSFVFVGLQSAVKLQNERKQIYELFQPWALSTYGDQTKTKTITLHKKARILKALEGKEHSRPDSSKFRFWVKTKGFTTKRPDGFEEAAGSQRRLAALPPDAVLSDYASEVDLYAASTNKDFGRRVYRKVACVEEFFDIIYNVHMELGGRSGMHAGQKRTYRIITETYAFLPREAVTRFLTICPECKKNLRPSSPSASKEDLANESSSEVEALNYSSHTESSAEASSTAKKRRHSNAECGLGLKSEVAEILPRISAISKSPIPKPIDSVAQSAATVPKIRVKLQLQRPLTPTLPSSSGATAPPPIAPTPPLPPIKVQVSEAQAVGRSMPELNPHCFDMQLLKSRDSFLRYYEFMRRFYAGGSLDFMLNTQPVLAPPIFGSTLLQSLSYPTTITTTAATSSSTSSSPYISKQTQPKVPSPTQSVNVNVSRRPSQSALSDEAPVTKKFKSSPDSLKNVKSALSPSSDAAVSAGMSLAPSTSFTKEFFSRSNGTPPPLQTQPSSSAAFSTSVLQTPKASTSSSSTATTSQQSMLLTSTPHTVTSVKLEVPSPPKPLPELRIPLVRPPVLSQTLPPLDLERLKPITSTYLQLTRSMGLSDEDALRFDNLSPKLCNS